MSGYNGPPLRASCAKVATSSAKREAWGEPSRRQRARRARAADTQRSSGRARSSTWRKRRESAGASPDDEMATTKGGRRSVAAE
jgi:hypothetical protein